MWIIAANTDILFAQIFWATNYFIRFFRLTIILRIKFIKENSELIFWLNSVWFPNFIIYDILYCWIG